MFRKVVAVLFVALWLVLLGIEFSEDTGFFECSEPDMDRSVETTLASLGEAIKVFDETQIITSRVVFAQPEALYPLDIQGVSFKWIRKETNFTKEDIPIYKLHRIFLI